MSAGRQLNSVDNVKTIGSTLVYVDFNVSSDYCWFNIYETGQRGNGVNSVTFLLSADDRSETTLGVSGVPTTSYAASGVPTGPAKPARTDKTTLTGTTLNTITDTPTPSLSSVPSPSPSTSPAFESGLSGGAKAGIGVGVGVGALLLVGGLTYWLLRRKRATQSGSWAGREGDKEVVEKAIGVATIHEIGDGRQLPLELDTSTGTLAELPEDTIAASSSNGMARQRREAAAGRANDVDEKPSSG
ncbi:hypothetical protein VFPBJ_04928 [Purpureocillium lilacinum]|uniref:Uncharacterized protein n=1 Tax=Purpureocillium lilacinum TaxID=33203 RepID=A0A179GWR7_PURLI|nr:hypothetical protein VFPBJ_04928 [Purpureocillium lilacinum]